jgi:hypothetical protein
MTEPRSGRPLRSLLASITLVASAAMAGAPQPAPQAYLHLPAPQLLALPAQAWEGDQQPHTMSVLEMNRDGYRYWAWYGLNNGRGMGLMRSNDLLHWTKFERNPLWLNARWPSVLQGDPAHPHTLYFAVTRDYDTPSSRIVLASSEDGIQLTELKNLAPPVPKQRNQNPNLFRDPVTKRYFLTFYRGNDEDYFDIVSKSAASVGELDRAPEKILLHTTETVAAPNLMYLPSGGANHQGIYYLATEIFPNRYNDKERGVWQVKVFYGSAPDGPFQPAAGNPVQTGERACLFQHVFDGNFYGYQSHLDHATDQWQMEVLSTPLPN